MRARSLGILTLLAVALALPASASAQGSGYLILVDNNHVDCDLPLPATVVVGELGTQFWVSDPAEIDKVTMSTQYGAYVVDVHFREGWHSAEITTSDAVSSYIVWSCAPLNGEPVQQNEPGEV